MSRYRIFLAAAIAVLAAQAHAGVADCDAHKAVLDQAQRLRVGGHADQAVTLIRLKANDPNDLRAQYALGLALLESGRARNAKPQTADYQAGFTLLAGIAVKVDSAAVHSPPAQLQCLKSSNVFTIDNLIGAELLNNAQTAQALPYLLKARQLDGKGLLTPDTHKKLLDNLGKAYFSLGDFKNARVYFTQAKDANAANGAKGLAVLDAIEGAGKQRMRIAVPSAH